MILIAGLINIETTLQVQGFPIEYTPVNYPFFGVNSTISGVGYNIAKALTTLDNPVRFLSLIGQDNAGNLVHTELQRLNIDTSAVLTQLNNTPQSVILYDTSGRRSIFVDLKDIQEQVYPPEAVDEALRGSKLAILCNINFSRPMLKRASILGIPIATDVHAISSLDDDYNRDYMQSADILFMSHERLPVLPEEWIHQLWNRFGTRIIVIGMGSEGALLAVRADNFIERIPAVKIREIKNTIGAGDALFSSFVHSYLKTGSPYTAIQKAVVFAGYKIGTAGAADGFLNSAELDELFNAR